MTFEDDLPTRAEIESMLDRVTLPVGTKKEHKQQRNALRHRAVEDSIADMNLAPVEQRKLLDDLSSYPQWENEEDGDA